MNHLDIMAKVCHQAMKAFCEAHNDYSLPDWEDAEDWQREATLEGIKYRLANPDATFDAQHVLWMDEKLRNGWVYGPEKNGTLKTHPCLVPFDALPKFQQQKDKLFCLVVDALRD